MRRAPTAVLLVAFALCAAPSLAQSPGPAPGGAASGVFLVAKREMPDPRFRETVVLVTYPQRGGPFGVIVNRPLGTKLSEVFPQYDSLKGKNDVLYFGGPVAREGLIFAARAAKPPPRSIRVLQDVWFTMDVEWVDELLTRADPTQGLRVYAGYSGWAPGQLQNEIARGDWHVVPADAATVFADDLAKLWRELIQRATRAVPCESASSAGALSRA
ncbi:MAG: YqgE/AlgH family protein [Betaproteobacteria bacterium]|nr:YqgE/AlgH family protein [Betaproteobacteria bacterium]